jgi:uncharacterized repeat protein (TIGR03803 family)
VLYSFDGTDGSDPQGELIFDAAGNLYGTTLRGGTSSHCSFADGKKGCGTVFKLTPGQGGGWTETVLHSFDINGTDGAFPFGDVIFDVHGNLYGATNGGGSGGKCQFGCGTVFKLTPGQGGGWTEKLLYNFAGPDGANPQAGVVFEDGSLYGTTGSGGHGNGTVFELTPTGGGNWTEKVVYNFGQHPIDGYDPSAAVIFAQGNLYGTTPLGGAYPGAGKGGTVFEIPGNATTKPWTQLATWEGTLVNDLAFPTAEIGFAAGQLGQVWKTTDGGSHWTPVMSLGSPYYWHGIAALNTNDVVVSGHDDGGMALLRWSHDGGSTWGPIINLGPYQLFRVRFADSKNGLALDDAGNAFSTTNGGETGSDWTRSETGADFLGIQFSLLPDFLLARAAGTKFCVSFVPSPWLCGPPIDKPSDDAVFFVDLDHGWVGGGEAGPEKPTGWVQFTTDDAATWSGRTLSSPWPVQEIRFVDRQNGWAVGGNAEVVGGIYSSKDGGQTWSLDFQNGYEMVSCAQATTQSGEVRVWCVGDTISGSALYAQTVPQ